VGNVWPIASRLPDFHEEQFHLLDVWDQIEKLTQLDSLDIPPLNPDHFQIFSNYPQARGNRIEIFPIELIGIKVYRLEAISAILDVACRCVIINHQMIILA
jgi:hypothetical protein